MGQRELSIIALARDTLNDTDEQNYRWSNQRLMEHLNDAQDDMCRELPLIVETVNIVTAVGVEKYFLPVNTVRALSATTGGDSIPFTSVEEMDDLSTEWEERKGSKYERIVVNQLSQFELRPYPLISDSQSNPDNFTIKIRYASMPLALGWDETEEDSVEQLVVSPMWDFALRHYIISMAFLDYGDESSLSRSQVSAGLYSSQIRRAKQLSTKGFAKRNIATPYQGKVVNNERLTRRGQRYGR